MYHMEKARLTFNKGMMPDLDISALPQGAYTLANNFSATPNDNGSLGSLVSAKGNALFCTIGYTTVGTCTIKDAVVIFAVNQSGVSVIYRITNNEDATLAYTNLVYSDISSVSKLGFSTSYPIDTVYVHNTDEDIRIYFAQENKSIRSINVATTYATSVEAKTFDIVQDYKPGSLNDIVISEGGNLKAGRITYAYRLAKRKGSITPFGYTSTMVNVTNGTVLNEGKGEFNGDDLDIVTDKKISFTITSIDTTYDYIYIYRIAYYKVNEPTISLVGELSVSTSSISFNDTGTVLAEITTEEFNSIGGRVFFAKTIEAKDNILFAANITEEAPELDIDCRAYRFDNAGLYSMVFQENGYYYNINSVGAWTYHNSAGTTVVNPDGVSTGTNWSLHKAADCINKYNNEYLMATDNGTITHPFNYCKTPFPDPSFYGGKGKHVTYKFVSGESGNVYKMTKGYQSIVNSDTINLKGGSHKRGETYRYGLQFYDLKGKPFPVKWIGDIRAPYSTIYSVSNPLVTSVGSREVDGTILKLNIVLDYSSIPTIEKDKVSGVRVVRCKRSSTDSTIIAQGASWKVRDSSNSNYTGNSFSNRGAQTSSDGTTFVHPFFSPELYYNDGGIQVSGDTYRMKLVSILGYAKAHGFDGSTVFYSYPNAGADSVTNVHFPIAIINTSANNPAGAPLIGATYKVFDFKNTQHTLKGGGSLVLKGNKTSASGTVNYLNRCTGESDYNENFQATSAAFTSRVSITKSVLDANLEGGMVLIFDAYVDKANFIYGGITYNARATSEYISASPFYAKPTMGNPIMVAVGDTFNTVFDLANSMIDPAWEDAGSTSRRQVATLIPIESRIDCAVSAIKPSKQIVTNKFNTGNPALQETTTDGITIYGEAYPSDTKDLMSYNTAYSSDNSFPKFYPDTLFTDLTDKLPYAIVASDKKTYNEKLDSWTNFAYSNIIEVDGACGKINAIKKVDNKMFYWQDSGIGILSTNDRYLLNEGTAGQLTLGAGGILERYDYISTNIGCEDKRQIDATETDLYWAYKKHKKLFSYNGQLSDLGMALSCNSFIKDNMNTTLPLVFADADESEVLFKLDTDKVLVYDPYVKAFISVSTYTPYNYCRLSNNKTLSSPDGKLYYTHGTASSNRCTYYGTKKDCYLKLIANQSFDTVKVFDTLNWQSTQRTSTGEITQNDTFTTARFSNDYQNTDWVTLGPKRKQRDFTAIVPRNVLVGDEVDIVTGGSMDPNTLFKARMRDRYLNIEMKYTSPYTGNKAYFNVPYIDINYRKSER